MTRARPTSASKPAPDRRALSPAEIHQRIDQVALTWSNVIPAERQDAFRADVHRLADDYLNTADRAEIIAALKSLHAACGRGPGPLAAAVAGVSPAVREWCAEQKISLPRAESITEEDCNDLRLALVSGGFWRVQTDQKRWLPDLRLNQPRGQPERSRERVLTANLAVAYYRATGQVAVRRRGTDDESPFERILHDVLVALGIDDERVSADKLVQWFVAERNRLQKDGHTKISD